MNWEELKSRIYHQDGSLRDIYIRDVTLEDWKLWVDYVNSNYIVEFEVGNGIKHNRIDFDAVLAFWQQRDKESLSASIHLGNILLKTYFFDEHEIDSDISPKEITTMQHHETLIEYLMNLSKILARPVEFTEESCHEPKEVLMVVHGGQVTFPNQLL
jgi:hypothetical protein